MILIFFTTDESLKKLAQEVLDLIKQLIGVEDFRDVYSKSNKKRTERIEERKRKSAQIVNIWNYKNRL